VVGVVIVIGVNWIALPLTCVCFKFSSACILLSP
jgi:hypothetical protein